MCLKFRTKLHARLPSEQQLSLAEPYIIKALELDPMLSEAYVSLGMLKRGRDDIQGSESAYKRAIELNPNNADAYERYGWLLRDYVDDNKGAAKLLRKAYELDPKSEVALNRLSQSYETLGKWSEALEVKRAWVEQQPENSLPFNQLGKLLEGGLGQFDEAIIAYRKAYALDSISPIIPNGIGDSYLSLGDIENAVWWYERSINLYKDPQRKAFYQTWIYNITGNTEAARRESLKALEVRGAYTSGYLKIVSRINLAAGDTGDSIAQYKETYPELFSSNATVDTNNYWKAADLARLLVASGESEQTDKLISGALEAVSSEPPWLGNRTIKISLHAIAGDHANALNALSSFIDDGGSPYSDTFRDDLKILAGNAEFEALLEKGKARMAKQLKRIREMEANGELAPIPDLPAN
jgi:tetratricopeptide (TPR) repeat protein